MSSNRGVLIVVYFLPVAIKELYKVCAYAHIRRFRVENKNSLKGQEAQISEGRKGSPRFKSKFEGSKIFVKTIKRFGVIRQSMLEPHNRIEAYKWLMFQYPDDYFDCDLFYLENAFTELVSWHLMDSCKR